jgi:hypothetical protein
MNYIELKNLNIDIQSRELSRLGIKENLVRLEARKAATLKSLEETETEVESTILVDKAKDYKNPAERKTAIKKALEVDSDYLKLNQDLSAVLLTIKGVELDLKRMQIEIDFLSRQFSIEIAWVNSRTAA